MSNPSKLYIGEIPYVNVFPIFHALRQSADISNYIIKEGYPSILNKMLRAGEIDICSSSSVEYLRNRDMYSYLEGHSISSIGPVKSIILFSRTPIEDLNRHEIYVTHQSDTSPVLLGVLLNKFYGASCRIQATKAPAEEALIHHSAYLSIGDDALIAVAKARKLDLKDDSDEYVLASIKHQVFYIYDLGNLWFKHTGLPFVFALWILRKDMMLQKKALFARFASDLDNAKKTAFNNPIEPARHSPLKEQIGIEGLISYWNTISYDLTDEHKKGLELFNKYASELGLLPYGNGMYG